MGNPKSLNLLRCLEYPYVLDADTATLAALLAWIEDRKLRIWEIEARTQLRTAGPEWTATFGAYLAALGCPTAPDDISTVPWLLRAAIDSEFDDDSYGTIADEAALASGSAHSAWRVDDMRAGLGVVVSDGMAKPAALGSCLARVAVARDRGNPSANAGGVQTFATGDPRVDEVATRMRLAYVADLRVLQDEVNGILSRAQDFVARPSTNGAL